jgi:hypothetical protein
LANVEKAIFWRAMLPHCRKKKFFGASPDAPSSNEILGSPGGSPSQTPNKFGAHHIRHQPLAEASGMVSCWRNFKIPCYGLQSVVDDEEPERRL